MFRFPLGLKTEPAFLCLPGYRGGCLDRRFIGEIGALSRFCSLPGSLVISGAGCSASFPTGRAVFQREQGLKQALTVFPPPFFFDRGQSHPVLAQQADPQQPGGHHQPGGGAAEGPHLATLLRQVFRGAAPVSAVSSGLRGRSWCQELLCTELKSRRVERAPLWLFCSSLFGPRGWGECC